MHKYFMDKNFVQYFTEPNFRNLSYFVDFEIPKYCSTPATLADFHILLLVSYSKRYFWMFGKNYIPFAVVLTVLWGYFGIPKYELANFELPESAFPAIQIFPNFLCFKWTRPWACIWERLQQETAVTVRSTLWLLYGCWSFRWVASRAMCLSATCAFSCATVTPSRGVSWPCPHMQCLALVVTLKRH